MKLYGGAFCVWCCFGMSWGVWGKVLVYLGGILRCQNCLGVFGDYLRVQSMQDWAVLKPTHHFGKTVKWKICSTWSLWDIKIPKPPHKSFLKIIELDHFLHFLGSSERYYLYQLLLITLYYWHTTATIVSMQCMQQRMIKERKMEQGGIQRRCKTHIAEATCVHRTPFQFCPWKFICQWELDRIWLEMCFQKNWDTL